jgi:hypothetical protein
VSKDNSGPAFPVIETDIQWLGDHGEDGAVPKIYSMGGMTLRDYFAAQALQGICASNSQICEERRSLARRCYEYADDMIAERNR